MLRRYSLDELPQLFNVLLGDMSLVGPRPVRPDEVPEQGDRMRHRLAAKPGLTGLWQVARLPYMPWYESERLQKRYVDNWSLVLDLQILWKMTAEVVQGRTRADITEAIHPHWRDVPQECEHGHPWEPDSVWVRWVLCECPSAIAGCTEGARGHWPCTAAVPGAGQCCTCHGTSRGLSEPPGHLEGPGLTGHYIRYCVDAGIAPGRNGPYVNDIDDPLGLNEGDAQARYPSVPFPGTTRSHPRE